MQPFLRPSSSPPSALSPGSADAVRLRSRLLLADTAPGPCMSSQEAEAKQAAYQRGRAAWLKSTRLRQGFGGQVGYRAEGE